MRQRPDDPARDSHDPEHGRYPEETRTFENEVSDDGADYDAGFDEEMIPTDDVEINEHGSER